ncbi:MAG: hypothetical protein IPM50_02815 [Acidobacteriota bacterium]|nr:MAG: hypothetical protein IPM50_02815 [Acidobacteriota bacterium]
MQTETINALIELFRNAVALHGGDVTNISITMLRTDDDAAENRFDPESPEIPETWEIL